MVIVQDKIKLIENSRSHVFVNKLNWGNLNPNGKSCCYSLILIIVNLNTFWINILKTFMLNLHH